MRLIFTTCLLLISSSALADSCIPSESQAFTILELTDLIRNPRCQIKSIDDLLAKTPEHVRSRLVLFFRSQSLQGPHQKDFINPRAILSSVEISYEPKNMQRALMMSFNGHESQPGYDRLEVVDINPKKTSADIFDYFEYTFPSDKQAQKLSWAEAQAKIKISEANPRKCQQCHGLPARPIFQAYPIWEGAFGSRHTREISLEERNGLEQFIRAHSHNNQSRYRHLNPARFSFEKGIQSYFNLRDPIFFGSSEHLLQMNSVLSNYNGVRMARIIKSQPMYPFFRYAILGAFEDCEHPSRFFPKSVLDKLKATVKNRFRIDRSSSAQVKDLLSIYSQGQTPNGLFPEGGDTPEETLANHRQAFDNDPDLFDIWTDTMSRQGPDRHATPAVMLRLIFEGMGYTMNNWWMDLQQPTYRYSSGTGVLWSRYLLEEDLELKNNPGFIEASERNLTRYAGLDCAKLAQLSVEALSQTDVTKLAVPYSNQVLENPLSTSYPQVFKSTCLQCHSDGQVGPKIPFHNPGAMALWLRQPNNLALIRQRITADEVERMPPTRVLTPNEMDQVLNYLRRF